MAVVDTLKAVVEAHPQARVVAFADLAAPMVLCSVGPDDMTQEHLDRLCRDALASFAEPMSDLAEQAFGAGLGSIVIDAGGVKLFLRSQAENDDALCCICDHSIDLAAFVATLRDTLDDISEVA